MTAAYLPPPPAPPHDPYSILLARRIGWQVLNADKIRHGDRLELVRFPGSLRALTEPSGSFGGLRTPRNAAIAPDGDLILLDPEEGELKRFDVCECAFVPIGCFDSVRTVAGIAYSGRDMFVCDPKRQVVEVFAMPDLALRKVLRSPEPWRPTCVAVWKGRIYVGDAQNGVIHRFDRQGRRAAEYPGFGEVHSIAIGCGGEVFAAAADAAYRLGEFGAERLQGSAEDVASYFEKLPFSVDPDGNLHLGNLCACPSEAIFDLRGNPFTPAPAIPVQKFEFKGTVVVGPLDSRIEECVWDLVTLHGDLPAGASISVDTYTSELEMPNDIIDTLPAYRWGTGITAFDFQRGRWDCMIRSEPGRYAWLRLTVRSDGFSTPSLTAIEIDYPRVSLRRHMPAVYGAEPISAEFTDRFLAIFDRELRGVESRIDNLAALFEPMATEQLDWLAGWIGVKLDRQLPEKLRRELLKTAGDSQSIRGTQTGLYRQLLTLLRMDGLSESCPTCQAPGRCGPPPVTCPPTPPPSNAWTPPPLILEHFRLRRWLEVGTGRLGDQAVLWGKRLVNRSQLDQGAVVGVTQLKASQDPMRDPFHFYAHKFTVFVPACAGSTPQKRQALEGLVKRESPAHTVGQIQYVEPRFRIGFQSMIGLDTVVASIPRGVHLNETTLGPASVLTGEKAGAHMGGARIGDTAI